MVGVAGVVVGRQLILGGSVSWRGEVPLPRGSCSQPSLPTAGEATAVTVSPLYVPSSCEAQGIWVGVVRPVATNFSAELRWCRDRESGCW